jgi:hypothetical protein
MSSAVYDPYLSLVLYKGKVWATQRLDDEIEITQVDVGAFERTHTRLFYPATKNKNGEIELDRSVEPITHTIEEGGVVEDCADNEDDDDGDYENADWAYGDDWWWYGEGELKVEELALGKSLADKL